MSESIFKRAVEGWAHTVVRHPWVVLAVAVVVTTISGVIVATSFDIRSDIKDLMPENAKSVQDTFAIADRMGSITTLSILLEAPERALAPAKKQSPEYAACRERAVQEWQERQRWAQAQVAEDGDSGDAADPAELGEPDVDVTAHCDDALILFAATLVDKLEEMDLVGYVHYRKRRTFFEDNILLYASVEDLEQLYSEVDESLTEARRMSGEYKACLLTATEPDECEALEPTLELLEQRRIDAHTGPALINGDNLGEPNVLPDGAKRVKEHGATLDATALRNEYLSKYEDSGVDFEEYMVFQLPDGAWVAKIQVRFRDGSTSLKANQDNLTKIADVVDSLEPTTYQPDLKVVYGGGFRTQQEEADAIVDDVKVSGGITVSAIALLLLFFFRRLRAMLILLIPLAMSIAWTFALTFATIGYLNLITAFIAAILLGLGIDFGIHLLVRFDQERTLGREPDEAMVRAIAEVGSANTSGAATTAATFLTLTIADFRGFSQFGVVACLGVVLALIAMHSVLPALAIVLQRMRPTPPLALRGIHMPSTKGKTWMRPAALVVGVTLVVTAAVSAAQVSDIGFEENFYRLGMRQQAWKQDANRYKVTEGSRHSSPVIVLLNSLEEVSALEMILREHKDPHVVYGLREFGATYPNLFDYMGRTFAAAISYSPKHAIWPAMTMTRRVTHSGWWGMPRFQRYDHHATEALWTIRAFIDTYPNLAGILASDLGTALATSHTYAALPSLVAMQRNTPEWLQGALPARRSNDLFSSVRDVASIYSFMPGTRAEQGEKLAVLERLRERTKPRKIRFLPKDDQKKVNQLRRYLVHEPVTVDSLPEWVKLQFKEGGAHPSPPREGSGVDYAFGNVALVYQSTSSMVGDQAHRLTGELRSVKIDGETPMMSTNAFVFSDMLHQIESDGLKVSVIALIIVILVVLVQFRSLLQTIIVVAPLAIALTWIGGLMALFDIKLGLFNLVILPVVIGIGIDNGIHLYHRYRENGYGGLLAAMRFTGGSIMMTSATTMVGFGGLTLSQHMGLNSMGELALVGIGACLLATLTVQPALLVLAEWVGARGLIGDRAYVPNAAPQAPGDAPIPIEAGT